MLTHHECPFSKEIEIKYCYKCNYLLGLWYFSASLYAGSETLLKFSEYIDSETKPIYDALIEKCAKKEQSGNRFDNYSQLLYNESLQRMPFEKHKYRIAKPLYNSIIRKLHWRIKESDMCASEESPCYKLKSFFPDTFIKSIYKEGVYTKDVREYSRLVYPPECNISFDEYVKTIGKAHFHLHIIMYHIYELEKTIHGIHTIEFDNKEEAVLERAAELAKMRCDGNPDNATKDMKKLMMKPLCEEEELNRNAEKNICLVVIFLFSVILCAFLAINGFMIALALLFAIGVACRELF